MNSLFKIELKVGDIILNIKRPDLRCREITEIEDGYMYYNKSIRDNDSLPNGWSRRSYIRLRYDTDLKYDKDLRSINQERL